jgi:hypothetical protein
MFNFISKIFGGSGDGSGGIIGQIGNVADKFIVTEEDRIRFKKELGELALREREAILKDVDSARDLQKAALAQEDVFAKRFLYYFAILIVVAAMGFGAGLFFIEVPEENRRLVEMFADVFVFSGALSVIYFFFGSSRSSAEKQVVIENRLK